MRPSFTGFMVGKWFFRTYGLIAFLETKPEITKELKLPECYPTSAYHPTNYSISYNDTGKEYTLALEGLTLR